MVTFEIKNVDSIMNEHEYPGIRVELESKLQNTRIPLEIDCTYKPMFEDRSINILAYNIETVLAEKIETIRLAFLAASKKGRSLTIVRNGLSVIERIEKA